MSTQILSFLNVFRKELQYLDLKDLNAFVMYLYYVCVLFVLYFYYCVVLEHNPQMAPDAKPQNKKLCCWVSHFLEFLAFSQETRVAGPTHGISYLTDGV